MHVLSENEIQNSILELLRFHGIYAWRNNNGAVYDPESGSFRRKSKYTPDGLPDILGILPDGKMLGIEVKKNSKCKPSEAQQEHIEKARSFGAIAFVAWNNEMVEKKLKMYI